MSYKIYFAITAILTAATAAAVICGTQTAVCATTAAAALIGLALCYRSVKKPLDSVQNGIYLIKEQDFSSRLRKVGQRDADMVIDLFNRLMETMKQERLRNLEQNDFLKKLIDASPTGIAICDLDGNIINENRAFREMKTPALSDVLKSLDEGTPVTVRQGQSQILRCSRQWFMDCGFRRHFYLVEPVTEEIIQAEKDIYNKIIRTIGHEVNNTVGSVGSVLETMEEIHREEPDVAGTLESCHRSCMNLCNFVKGYSDVVKLPDPETEITDMNRMAIDLLPTLKNLSHNGIIIETESSDEPATAEIDQMLMERVIINIVKNSIESITAAGITTGKVTISTAPGSLTVTDNGKGIDPTSKQLIFTPFYSTKHPDRGLGLMLVTDILRRHHAEFSLGTSEADGLTRFRISFPQKRNSSPATTVARGIGKP